MKKIIMISLLICLVASGCSKGIPREDIIWHDLETEIVIIDNCIELNEFEIKEIIYQSRDSLPKNITIDDNVTIILDNISLEGIKILDFPEILYNLTNKKASLYYWNSREDVISTNKENYMKCGLDEIIEIVEKNMTNLAKELCYVTPSISYYRIRAGHDVKIKVCFNENVYMR